MRQTVVVVHTFCDIHRVKEADPRYEADPDLSLSLTYKGKAKRLDLCPLHKNPQWSDMQESWVDDLSAEPAAPPRGYLGKSKHLPCPICGEPNKAATPHGQLMHARRRHRDVPLEKIQEMLGFPITGRDRSGLPPRPATQTGPHKAPCPKCDGGAKDNRGLAQHLIRTHGITNKSERDKLMKR